MTEVGKRVTLQKWKSFSENFLVICAGTSQARSTVGIVHQKYVYSSVSLKMVLNCVHKLDIGPIYSCLVLLTLNKMASGANFSELSAIYVRLT